MNSGVQWISIYTLMNLKGTPLASEEFAEKYSHVINHRIVPRQFSVINGQKIFDTEEVIIGTKYMSFEDYIYLRGVSFIVDAFFGSAELIPLKRFLLQHHIDIADWIFNIYGRISEFPDLKRDYDNFMMETREELFPTREKLIEFYNQDKNFNDLIKGIKGDNLLRKYKCIILSENYDSYLKLAIEEAGKLIREKLSKEKTDKLIDNLENYLSTRNMGRVLSGQNISEKKHIKLFYDIPQWLKHADSNKLLEEFEGSYSYNVVFSADSKRGFDNFMNMNKDRNLSLQILYRDGGIKNLWPDWIKEN